MKNQKDMGRSEVSDFFDTHFGDYDDWISKVVPFYDELQTQIINVIGCFYPDKNVSINVLELGVGSGTTAKHILSNYPNTNITGIEFSDEMIKLAKNKLKKYKKKLQILKADFMDVELPPGKYDVIISSLSIHHYKIEDIRRLMKKLHSALKSGGIFINADIVKFRSPEYSGQAHKVYLDFLRENLCDESAIKVWERHIELQDNPSPLEDLLINLAQSGFRDVAVSFRFWGFAVYSGRK
ncbi:MAG TPA: class I SAM-dependent methyltransferase [Candidatus Nanoarchaeia archaeon]|nr:class I SAM-dependent methyltransferase [Candidatus Nanoarchaeia archaeon]